MDTYRNTGNEGHRGYGDGNGDVNTSGNRVNEPSRNRDFININIVVYPDTESPVSMQANLEWTLDKLHSSSAEICSMNPGQCHSSCDGLPLSGSGKVRETGIQNDSIVTLYEGEGTPTPGVIKNEPSKHKDFININIVVYPDTESPVSMQANLEWTLDKLHSSSAKICSMNPGQCHSSCDGLPLSGSGKVRETGIQNDSTVILYEGEGTPTPGVIKNEPSKHKVQILIKKPNGKTEPMNVVLSWSQDLFVEKVDASIDMVKGQYFILFGSKQLGGKKLLLDAGIMNGSTIRVHSRLLGGSQ